MNRDRHEHPVAQEIDYIVVDHGTEHIVEASVIGWEMRSDAVGRAVVTVMQPRGGLSMRTEG
jgi:hypothetical protein